MSTHIYNNNSLINTIANGSLNHGLTLSNNAGLTFSNNTGLTLSNNAVLNSITLELEENIVEYIDFAFKIMGVKISYSQFKEMSESERKSFLRDLKINKIMYDRSES